MMMLRAQYIYIHTMMLALPILHRKIAVEVSILCDCDIDSRQCDECQPKEGHHEATMPPQTVKFQLICDDSYWMD